MTKIGYNDGYSNEDKETSLAFDYISETWEVWSTVPRHIRKLYELCNNDAGCCRSTSCPERTR